MSTVDTYTQRLILALQARKVPADRIGEVVAEVDSHVAESGEEPEEAFGTPKEYARAVAPDGATSGRSVGVAWVLGGVTGWLVATTVFRLVGGSSEVYGLPIWVMVVVSAAMVAITAVAAGRQRAAVRDPRDGGRMSPSGTVGFLIVIGGCAAVLAPLAALLL